MREAETRAALERQKQTDEWVEMGTAVMVFRHRRVGTVRHHPRN